MILIDMILGYDFIEERLFAFRDYANLTEEGIKSLRKNRSKIAKWLKESYDYKKLLKDSDRRRIINESGGDVNKIFDKIGRKTKNVNGRMLVNYANPEEYNKILDRLVGYSRRRANEAAEIAKRL